MERCDANEAWLYQWQVCSYAFMAELQMIGNERSLFGLLVTEFYMQHNVINTVQLQQVDILIS